MSHRDKTELSKIIIIKPEEGRQTGKGAYRKEGTHRKQHLDGNLLQRITILIIILEQKSSNQWHFLH